jgi:ribosomal protein S3AE
MAESKGKKKKFVKIISTKNFNEQIIGESLVMDKKLLIGRSVRLNMMSLTNDPKNQNIQLKFLITHQRGEDVGTEIIGYKLLPTFIKRLVRKEKKRADDCFSVKTSDDKKVVLKLFMLTLNLTTKSVLKALRREAREIIFEKFSKTSYDLILKEILQHRFQNELKKKLSKIYPLRFCEVRHMSLVLEKETEVSKDKTKKEEIKVVEEKAKEEVKTVEKTKVEPVKEDKKEVKPEAN